MAKVLMMLCLFVVPTWIKPIMPDRTENQVAPEWSNVHNISSYVLRIYYYLLHTVFAPSKVSGLHCEYSGNVVTLVWDAPHGLWSEFEVQVNEGIPKHVNIPRYRIDDVLSSVQYEISVTSLSGKLRSDPVSIMCQTNASGAIAGIVSAVFFVILLLVGIGVFCKRKKIDFRRCFFGELGNVENTANLPMDLIYVNTSTHNTPKNQDSSVKSENIDNSGENNFYEVPDPDVII